MNHTLCPTASAAAATVVTSTKEHVMFHR